MPIDTLSYDNLELCVPLFRHIGDGVTLLADTTGAAPRALARPAADNLASTAVKAWQMYPTSYGFDHRSIYATNQGIQVVFESAIDGLVEVAVRNCQLDVSSTLDFGDYTAPANVSSALYVRATIGATTSGGLYATGGDVAPIRDNNSFSFFKWSWFTTDFYPGSGGNIQTFPVVRGTNTLTIRGYNTFGDGWIGEAIYIRLRRHDADRNRPRRTIKTLPAVVNRTRIETVLQRARTEPIRVLFLTDSFGVASGNWAVTLAGYLRSAYGSGGLNQRLGANSSNYGTDLAELDAGSWATATSRAATTVIVGGASYLSALSGAQGHKWTTAQTGSITHTFVGTSWRIIHETLVGGGSYTYAINGATAVTVSTAGTADRYGQVGQTDLTYGAHTIVITKAGSSEVRLLSTTTARETGIVAMRLVQSGSNFGTFYADALDGAWASLLAAYQPHVIIHGSVNNSFVSPNYDLNAFLTPLNNRLPTLCDTSGAVFCVAELFPFTVGTYTTPDTYFKRHGFPQSEFNTDMMELAAQGFVARPITFISWVRDAGYANTEALMYNAIGYTTQSAASGTITISNMHPTAAGNGLVGQSLAKLLTDQTAPQNESDLATLLTRLPGIVQPQTGDAFARIGTPAGASVAADVAAVKTDTGGIVTTLTTLAATTATEVWAAGTRSLTTFGTLVADVWAATTRTLSDGTNIVLAKGTGVTGFNDLSTAQVRDAMKLAPTAGAAATGSVDDQLAGIAVDADAAATKAGSTSDAIDNGTLLDNVPITAPTGPASTFPNMIVQTWRRFFKRSTLSSTQLKTYADDGTTVVTTQTVVEGSPREHGAAS